MRDFTARLPPEVLRMIFDYILSDLALKSARLVNKKWSAVAAALLWYQLRVDIRLYETHRDRFDALLNSSPYGILDNVKKLNIDTACTTSSAADKQQVTSALIKLFSALPRDSLMSLHSETLPIHPDVICVLLRTQNQLREFEVLIDEDSPDGLPGGIYARHSLSLMEKIKVDVVGRQHQTYRGLCAWLIYASKLHYLNIMGRRGRPNSFEGWTPSAQPHLVRLRRLVIRNVSLPGMPERITQHLHIPSLEVLHLKDCSSVEPFMLALAQEYKQTKRYALKIFSHITERESKEDPEEASAKLIESVNGLTDIVSSHREADLTDLQCLKTSGGSLCSLKLFCDNEDPVYYSAEDLDRLRLICPVLEDLRIDLGDLSSIFDDVGLTEPFRLAGHTSYVKKLEAIAQYSNLISLHISDPALLGGDYSANERRFQYTEVATQIFQELAKHGSRLQQIHFTPGRYECSETEADDDGHTWPQYAFERGRVSMMNDGHQRAIKTIAIPAPHHVKKPMGHEDIDV